MALTYGFYDSMNGDRVYNAEQVSQMFDGVITDGVFASFEDGMKVIPGSSGLSVRVRTGRAWFNHTWSWNSAITEDYGLATASPGYTRIDAMVLEINRTVAGAGNRTNSFKIVTGTASMNPQKPTLVHTEGVDQYALAYITVGPGATSISQANIQDNRGTAGCPFVSGSSLTVKIQDLIDQWTTQFANYYSTWTATNQRAYEQWVATKQQEYVTWIGNNESAFTSWQTNQQNSFASWISTQESSFASWMSTQQSEFAAWRNEQGTAFSTWFAGIQSQLDGDIAGKINGRIDRINHTVAIQLTAAGWSGSGPWTQTVTRDTGSAALPFTGAASEHPRLYSQVESSWNTDTQKAYIKAFGIVSSGQATTGSGSVTFKVWKKPVSNITVILQSYGAATS